MITPKVTRIMSQDFPEDVRSWIHSLLTPLNQFMASINAFLNKGLTFQNHFNAEIKTIQIKGGESVIFSHQLKTKPIGVLLLRSDEELKSPVTIDWENATQGIKIRHALGIEPGKNHTLTLLIIGG